MKIERGLFVQKVVANIFIGLTYFHQYMPHRCFHSQIHMIPIFNMWRYTPIISLPSKEIHIHIYLTCMLSLYVPLPLISSPSSNFLCLLFGPFHTNDNVKLSPSRNNKKNEIDSHNDSWKETCLKII